MLQIIRHDLKKGIYVALPCCCPCQPHILQHGLGLDFHTSTCPVNQHILCRHAMICTS
uniref:Uncharacterized protein n=1 Tax=Rhizophora mucronata TaxID=61149 RepID=A0A2P2QGT5_RHIMU